MKHFRTHLVPVLTIMAGGAIGASLSFSLLASSPDALPPVVVDVQPEVIDVPAIQKPVLRIEVDGYPVLTAERIEIRGIVVTPSATRESAIQTEGPDGSIVTSARIMFGGMVISSVVEPSASLQMIRNWLPRTRP